MEFFRRTQGSISIFLILIMVPMYTGAYFAVDYIRYYASKDKVNGVLELLGNSVLSNFNYYLHDEYGVFAMSLDENEQKSLLESLSTDNLSYGLSWNRGFLSQEDISIDFNYLDSYRLTSSNVLDEMILLNEKYKAPYKLTSDFISKLDVLSNITEISKSLEALSEYMEEAYSVEKKLKEIWNLLPNEAFSDISSTVSNLENAIKKIEGISSEVSNLEKKYQQLEETISSIKSVDIKEQIGSVILEVGKNLGSSALNSLKNALLNDLNELKEKGKEAVITYTKNLTYEYLNSIFKDVFNVDAANLKSNLENISKLDITKIYKDIENVNIPQLISGSIYNDILQEGNISVNESPESLSNINDESEISSIMYVVNEFSKINLTLDNIRNIIYVSEFIHSNFNSLVGNDSSKELTAEAEYIIFGSENQLSNIRMTLNLIFAIRFVLNSLYAFSNKEMRNQARAAGAIISSVTGAGAIIARNVILLTWSMAEAYVDLINICDGQSVAILKNGDSWMTQLENLPKILTGEGLRSDDSISSKVLGMTYEDFLFLFATVKLLGSSSKTNMLKRSEVIMQINCQNKDQNFNISKCYSGAEVTIHSKVSNHELNESKIISYQ